MKKVTFGIGIVAAIVIYSLCLLQFSDKNNSAASNPTAEENINQYLVKEYNGGIAVFIDGDKTPVRTLNIDTDNLTSYDRSQFQKGIRLNSMENVLLLEEDFNS